MRCSLKRQKLERGEYGYLRQEKNKYLRRIILYLVIAMAIFITGLFLNKFSTKNIFTVVAIMVVLPWARAVVGMVTLFPFHPTPKEDMEKVRAKVPEGAVLYCDMVITSTEHVMGLQYMVKTVGSVIAISSMPKFDARQIQNYLSKGVHNWCSDYQVKVYAPDQMDAFLRAIPSIAVREIPASEEENVCAHLRSLIV